MLTSAISPEAHARVEVTTFVKSQNPKTSAGAT
jgi:hypothetical protein